MVRKKSQTFIVSCDYATGIKQPRHCRASIEVTVLPPGDSFDRQSIEIAQEARKQNYQMVVTEGTIREARCPKHHHKR